jgi:hypothetical protein
MWARLVSCLVAVGARASGRAEAHVDVIVVIADVAVDLPDDLDAKTVADDRDRAAVAATRDRSVAWDTGCHKRGRGDRGVDRAVVGVAAGDHAEVDAVAGVVIWGRCR